MVTGTSAPSPQKITGHLIGAFPSAALIAGMQLELFTALGDDTLTGYELATRMGVGARRLLPILNVLRVSGFLRRVGERYRNSEEAAYYLVKGKPTYIGGMHELFADFNRVVQYTAASIREDRPLAKHDFANMGAEDLDAFFRGLHGLGVVQGRSLAIQHNFARFKMLADVGGGSGNIAIGACQAAPGLKATVLELERIVPIAERFIEEAGLSDRISAHAYDVTTGETDIRFDVAVLRNLIQVLDPESAALAIRNIGRGMASGGELYIIGCVLDDERQSPMEAVAYDVVFVNIYDAGQSYTDREYRAWLAAADLEDYSRTLPGNNMSLISARKR